VEGEGFEPSKLEAADLQSAPFDHSGIPPNKLVYFADKNTLVKKKLIII
jgi:hypothetical protein